MQKERVGKGVWVADRKQPGKSRPVVRRLGLCGEGVGHRLVSGVVSAPLRYYLSFTLRFALFYSPCIFG